MYLMGEQNEIPKLRYNPGNESPFESKFIGECGKCNRLNALIKMNSHKIVFDWIFSITILTDDASK